MAIISQPWLPRLDQRLEIRAFVSRGRVTAFSQQKWYENLDYSASLAVTMARQLCHYYESKIKPVLPFVDAILDVWFETIPSSSLSSVGSKESKNNDENTNVTYVAHLIECNPWGAWNSSGSSLFHWAKHHHLLYNTDGVVYAAFATSNVPSQYNIS
jgi:hypothetical protein